MKKAIALGIFSMILSTSTVAQDTNSGQNPVEEDFNNLAISCKFCNRTKKYYDAREKFPNANPTREQLISASRDYINERKEKIYNDILRIRKIKKQFLDENI